MKRIIAVLAGLLFLAGTGLVLSNAYANDGGITADQKTPPKHRKSTKHFSAHDKSQVSGKLKRKSTKPSAFLKNSKGDYIKGNSFGKFSKTNDKNAFIKGENPNTNDNNSYIKGETRFDKSNGFIKSEAGPGNDKGVPSAHP